MEKLNYNTTKAHTNQKRCTTAQNKQEGQHPLPGQRAANFRLLANQ